MEEAVRECVYLKTGHRRDRVLRGMAEHVVPLENLVQDDAINEPPSPGP